MSYYIEHNLYTKVKQLPLFSAPGTGGGGGSTSDNENEGVVPRGKQTRPDFSMTRNFKFLSITEDHQTSQIKMNKQCKFGSNSLT